MAQGPPSCSLSSAVHWRRLDPSETIVLNQATLLRVNELLQSEIKKRQAVVPSHQQELSSSDDSTTQSQIEEASPKDGEAAAACVKSSDIIRQCHSAISSLKHRKQMLKKRKYEEFVKFAQDQEYCMRL